VEPFDRTIRHQDHPSVLVAGCEECNSPAAIAARRAERRPRLAILASDDEWSMIRFGLIQRAESFRASSPRTADEYEQLAARLYAAMLAGGSNVSHETSPAQAAELDRLDGRL
jgi:hypothetical protein